MLMSLNVISSFTQYYKFDSNKNLGQIENISICKNATQMNYTNSN